MNITLIDSGHFKLTPEQARQLCMANLLPRHGYEMMANSEVLKRVKLGALDRDGVWHELQGKATDAKSAWVGRTKISTWQGKPVKNGWVWALRLHY